jgi:hypothetical protein
MNDNNKARLTHYLMLAGKRVVPAYFMNANEEKFWNWQANACRQTAMFTAYYLDMTFPDRKVHLYESKFQDVALGQDYEHAYVWVEPEGNEKGIFVDVSRVSYPCAVEWWHGMPDDLSTYWSNAVGRRVLQKDRTEIEWQTMLLATEYYTDEPFMDVVKEIEGDMNRLTRR